MIDDLLGRTELKERIEELEDQIDALEGKLDAAERKRKNAVTEKQESDRRVNELESKVEELRDRLERAESEEEEYEFRLARTVRDEDLAAVLDLLETARSGAESLTTVHVAPDDSVPDEFGTETTALLHRIESKTGLVAFGDDTGVVRAALVPPVAVDETRVEHAAEFVFDRSLFELSGTYAVAVVRSDEYAGGVYVDGERAGFSSRSTEVKSKHSKGGYSQGRFERARDEEVKSHVRDSIEEFEATVRGREVERVFVAGESRVADRFVDELSLRVPVSKHTTDATGSGEDLLRGGYETVRSARLYVI